MMKFWRTDGDRVVILLGKLSPGNEAVKCSMFYVSSWAGEFTPLRHCCYMSVLPSSSSVLKAGCCKHLHQGIEERNVGASGALLPHFTRDVVIGQFD
jgi:hypothetical protein